MRILRWVVILESVGLLILGGWAMIGEGGISTEDFWIAALLFAAVCAPLIYALKSGRGDDKNWLSLEIEARKAKLRKRIRETERDSPER